MMKRDYLLRSILALYAAAVLAAVFSWAPKPGSWTFWSKKEARESGRVAEVLIDGVIRTDLGRGEWAPPDADALARRLYALAEREDVKAILLRINSPGGTVGAVQQIHSAVSHCQSKGKKVVASMGDVAASGGYYVAAPADRIFAEPGTITGSIGVIFQFGNLRGLMRKAGVELEVIKSGEFKDMGSPARALKPEERRLLQASIDDAYAQFLEAVVEGRRQPVETIRPVADGRIMTGRQALAAGLVDELGGRREALVAARSLAHLAEDAPVITDRHRSMLTLLRRLSSSVWDRWLGALAPAAGPALEYRWL